MTLKRKYWFKKMLPFFSVALATLYISSFIFTDLVHPLVHHQEYAGHSRAEEQDPCHREIYHGEKESTGTHHQHLTQSQDKCRLCDIIFDHEHLRSENRANSKTVNPNAEKTSVLSAFSFGFIALTSSRGPPVLV